jgi:hypothetical protein
MAATADSRAITHTVQARKASQAIGVDISGLQIQLALKLDEAKALLKQIIALAPGGDANLTALNTLLSQL